MHSSLTRSDLADVLRFYFEAGLDFAIEEDQQNNLVAVAPIVEVPITTVLSKPVSRPTMASPSMAVPDEATVARAVELAGKASSLDELKQTLENFDGCGLKFTAKNLVFDTNTYDPKIIIIGDTPSREDDLNGKPFSGAAGQLLDKMLGSIGLDRTRVYLSNVIFWRPPGNRAPTPMEIEICRPFILRQIELLQPTMLILLGDLTTKCLLPNPEGILRIRGNWTQVPLSFGHSVPALPMVHPDYLLRQPSQKKLAWRDLLSLKARLS